jgi:hypothetical protein
MHMASLRRKIMQQQSRSPLAPWRHGLWLAMLVGASVAFTLGLACAVPLAAFAAAAALTLSRRDGLFLIVAVWLANQFIGFTVLDYPWTAGTFAWGVALGAVAVLATLAGQRIVRHSTGTGRAVGYTVTFLVAFAVYEAALYAISATLLGGTEIYTAAIQGRIFLIDAAAFAALLVLHRLAISIGLTVNADWAVHQGKPGLAGRARA